MTPVDRQPVNRVSIHGGLKIASDGTYSSEGLTLAQVHAACADALVAMDDKRDVILAFRKANNFPKQLGGNP